MITITKALELLNRMSDHAIPVLTKEERKALKLGVKGLERFRGLRNAGHFVGMPLLKGEKEEVA